MANQNQISNFAAYDTLMVQKGFKPSGTVDNNHYYYNEDKKQQVCINERENLYRILDEYGFQIRECALHTVH